MTEKPITSMDEYYRRYLPNKYRRDRLARLTAADRLAMSALAVLTKSLRK